MMQDGFGATLSYVFQFIGYQSILFGKDMRGNSRGVYAPLGQSCRNGVDPRLAKA